MLVDFVSYSGELDMLKARLKHMGADLTIVYEADRSYTGIPKQLSDLSEVTNDRVIHFPIEGTTFDDAWENEYAQRRAAFEFLKSLDVSDDAFVALCDVDEFLDLDLLSENPALSVWFMDKFQMSARWFQQQEFASVSGLMGDLRNRDIVEIFFQYRRSLPQIRGGWHLSSFLTVEELQAKWRNFSHQEFVRPNMDEWVGHCWVNGLAVENGNPMTEMDLSGVPAAVLDGPEFWFRGRP